MDGTRRRFARARQGFAAGGSHGFRAEPLGGGDFRDSGLVWRRRRHLVQHQLINKSWRREMCIWPPAEYTSTWTKRVWGTNTVLRAFEIGAHPLG